MKREINYKGATITIEATTKEYREQALIFNNINFYVNVRNAGVGVVNNLGTSDLAKCLFYVRKKILNAKNHPKHGW